MVEQRGWIDCETYSSALASVSLLYKTSSEEIKAYLAALDLDHQYAVCEGSTDADDLLQIRFDKQFGAPECPVSGVSWFHLTRAVIDNTFSEGILPLGKALEKIWNVLLSIPKDARKIERLRKLKAKGVPNHLYQMKVSDQLHHGPYAMLVRESAFHAEEMGNHDYLAVPEIIEDICSGYEEEFGENIQSEITEALRPCIVKFREESTERTYVITPILHYCLCKAQNKALHINANDCFDGKGLLVSHDRIENVEYL